MCSSDLLSNLAFMQASTLALREIRGGIGKWVLSCPRADDGIAIHWSESSRIADSLFNSSPSSNAYVSAVGNIVSALEDADSSTASSATMRSKRAS